MLVLQPGLYSGTCGDFTDSYTSFGSTIMTATECLEAFYTFSIMPLEVVSYDYNHGYPPGCFMYQSGGEGNGYDFAVGGASDTGACSTANECFCRGPSTFRRGDGYGAGQILPSYYRITSGTCDGVKSLFHIRRPVTVRSQAGQAGNVFLGRSGEHDYCEHDARVLEVFIPHMFTGWDPATWTPSYATTYADPYTNCEQTLATFDGLTIQHGRVRASPEGGGGVRIDTPMEDMDGCNVVHFRSCTIQSNQALSRGGGVMVERGQAVFESCTLQNNMINYNYPELDSTFTMNQAEADSRGAGGGGIHCKANCSLQLFGNTFTLNGVDKTVSSYTYNGCHLDFTRDSGTYRGDMGSGSLRSRLIGNTFSAGVGDSENAGPCDGESGSGDLELALQGRWLNIQSDAVDFVCAFGTWAGTPPLRVRQGLLVPTSNGKFAGSLRGPFTGCPNLCSAGYHGFASTFGTQHNEPVCGGQCPDGHYCLAGTSSSNTEVALDDLSNLKDMPLFGYDPSTHLLPNLNTPTPCPAGTHGIANVPGTSVASCLPWCAARNGAKHHPSQSAAHLPSHALNTALV